MITISVQFDNRPDAESFAKEIEDAYPPEQFATVLTISRLGPDETAAGAIPREPVFLVFGSRQEKPLEVQS